MRFQDQRSKKSFFYKVKIFSISFQFFLRVDRSYRQCWRNRVSKTLKRRDSFFTVEIRTDYHATYKDRAIASCNVFNVDERSFLVRKCRKDERLPHLHVMNRYEPRSSTAGSTGSKSFLWKLRLRSGEYSSVKKFQAPAEFRYEAACYSDGARGKGATAENQRARQRDDKTGKLNRPHCYARVNEYISSRSFLLFLPITTNQPTDRPSA